MSPGVLPLVGPDPLAIALTPTLAVSPEVVLLDEPLSALDAKLRQELRVELKEILSAVGATTIVVTHDQEEAMSLGDSVIAMSEGRVMQQGRPTEIYADPKTRFVAEFISRSNWFSGRLGAEVAENVREFTTNEGHRILVPRPDGSTSDRDAWEICIRPERIGVDADGNARDGAGPLNRLRGTVRDISHLGAVVHLVIELEGGRPITATEQYLGQPLEQAGKSVDLVFRPEDCVIVPADS